MPTYEYKCPNQEIGIHKFENIQVSELCNFDTILESRFTGKCINCGYIYDVIEKSPIKLRWEE